MTTEHEHRVFNHLLRMVSILVIIQLNNERGRTEADLAPNLAIARQYLMEHCPALLLFTELCYRGQAIPEGLGHLAEIEAISGRGFRQ
jgi:hypothetical protein